MTYCFGACFFQKLFRQKHNNHKILTMIYFLKPAFSKNYFDKTQQSQNNHKTKTMTLCFETCFFAYIANKMQIGKHLADMLST